MSGSKKCFFCGSTENVHSRNVFDGTPRIGIDHVNVGTVKHKNVCNECFFIGQPDMDVEHAQALLSQKRLDDDN